MHKFCIYQHLCFYQKEKTQMAKNNKKTDGYARDLSAKEDLSEFAETGATEVAPEATDNAPHHTIDSSDTPVDAVAVAKALFAAYDAAEASLTEVETQAKALVDAAKGARSDAVKAILDGTGENEFTRKGVEIKIVARETKPVGDKSGYTTYFFKGAKKEKKTPLQVD